MLLTFAILLVLLLINAAFAMSEIAIVSSKRVRLEQLASKGDRGAASALKLANNPTRFLSTAQIGITVTAILAGAFGEKALVGELEEELKKIEWLGRAAPIVSLVFVVGSITFFSLLVGELVPKRIGMAFPVPIARATAGAMLVISRIAAPLVAVLSWSTAVILATLRIKPGDGHNEEVSEDDVRAMINKGADSGVFHASEQRLLERVLRLDDLRIRALMVPRSEIIWLDCSAGPEMLRLAVATSPFSHFPVCDGELDNVIGFIHVKELVKHGMISGGQINLRELAHGVLYVPENTAVLKLLDVFRDKRAHIAMVVDEYGVLVGLITLNDIVDVVLGSLPRRGDDDEPMITVRDDGSVLVDGQLPLDELARALGIDPHDFEQDAGMAARASAATVAGLILLLLGHVPKTGEKTVYRTIELEVVDMDRSRIDKVLARRVPPDGQSGGQAIDGAGGPCEAGPGRNWTGDS